MRCCTLLNGNGHLPSTAGKRFLSIPYPFLGRALGIPGDQIIFNGPHKPAAALERAVREGAAINVDHLDELCDLEGIADKLERRVPVGLRLNLDAGVYRSGCGGDIA
jgi:hypothetical protein